MWGREKGTFNILLLLKRDPEPANFYLQGRGWQRNKYQLALGTSVTTTGWISSWLEEQAPWLSIQLLKVNLCGWSCQMFINRENRALQIICVPTCRTLTSMCCTTAESCSRTGCLIGIWSNGCKLCFSFIRHKPIVQQCCTIVQLRASCFCTELKHDCCHLHYWSASKLVPLFHAGLHIHTHTHTYVYCPGE